MFGIPWSLGATLDVDSRSKFDAYYRDLLNGKIEEFPIPKSVGKIEIPFPDNGEVFDFCYEVRKTDVLPLCINILKLNIKVKKCIFIY